MKAKNLREQTSEELQQAALESEIQLRDLRLKRSVGESAEQPLKLRTLRRDVARIKTVLRERELN